MSFDLKWYGHGTFGLTTGKHTLVIDPFFVDNPVTEQDPDEVEADYVLVSHGHHDHIADAARIALRTGAP